MQNTGLRNSGKCDKGPQKGYRNPNYIEKRDYEAPKTLKVVCASNEDQGQELETEVI
jgi:hypothetical protein